ncbi:hypothetical protein ACIGNX_20470 [Actinosynnema sp. NPDC053489]
MRDSGFDRLAELTAVASTRDRAFLFGAVGFPPAQQVHVWSAPLNG